MIDINKNPSKNELLVFGALLLVFAGLLGGMLFWQWQAARAARYVWIAGGLLAVLHFLIPPLRRPLYLVWMYLAFPIGWTVSHLLLALIYYVVLTPVGLLLRLFGKDPMQRKLEPGRKSYWIEHRPRSDAKSYFRQF